MINFCYSPGQDAEPRSAFAHQSPLAIDDRAADPFRGADSVTGGAGESLGGMMQDLLGGGNGAIDGFTAGRVQGGLSPAQQAQSLIGWVFVAVNRIRNGVARTPLRAYESRPDGKKPEEIVDPKWELNSLLRNPNPTDTRSEFWSQTVTFLELTGNAIWLKVRDLGGRGKVKELWCIPSQYVTPGRAMNGLLVSYFFHDGQGGRVEVPAADVVHHKYSNPKNRWWGLGTLSAAADALKSQNAIKAAQLKSFENDVLSTLYFTTDDMLDEGQWKRVYATIRERYVGPAKAGTPVLLFGGVKPASIQRPPMEMAFRESAMVSRDEILGIFGVPPLLAGIVENANNSNTASQERVFAAYTLHPKLVHIQERINKDLVPEFDESAEVEFDNPVPSDLVMESNIRTKDVTAGLLTINEAREQMGLPHIEGGDVPRFVWEAKLKSQSAPQGNDVQSPTDSNPKPVVEEKSASKTQVEGPSSGRKSGRRLPAAARSEVEKRLVEVIRRGIGQDYARLQRSTVPTLRTYFGKQAERIKKNLDKVFGHLLAEGADRSLAFADVKRSIFCVTSGQAVGRLFPDGTAAVETGVEGRGSLGGPIAYPECRANEGVYRNVLIRQLDPHFEDGLEDWGAAADRLAERMLPKLEEAMQAGGDAQYSTLGFNTDFNLQNDRAIQWLEGKQRDYWMETVNATTKSLLSERLADVLADKPTIEKLAAAVEEVMGGRIKSSSETIARTEIIGAYNGAAEIVRTELGITLKEWVTTKDIRARGAHLEADGQKVAQGGSFLVKGEQLRYPGDPAASVGNIANCRCAAIAVFEDVESLRELAVAPAQDQSGIAGVVREQLRKALRECGLEVQT